MWREKYAAPCLTSAWTCCMAGFICHPIADAGHLGAPISFGPADTASPSCARGWATHLVSPCTRAHLAQRYQGISNFWCGICGELQQM